MKDASGSLLEIVIKVIVESFNGKKGIDYDRNNLLYRLQAVAADVVAKLDPEIVETFSQYLYIGFS